MIDLDGSNELQEVLPQGQKIVNKHNTMAVLLDKTQRFVHPITNIPFLKAVLLFLLVTYLSLGSVTGSARAEDSEILRKDTFVAGNVTQIAAARSRHNFAVTAVRDSDGNLRVISWRVRCGTPITRRDTEVAGAVSEIALTQARDGFVVTAVRDSDGNLRVISWEVEPNGTITRRDTEVAGAVSEIAVAQRLDPFSPLDTFIVTAVRDSDGDLRVISWSVSNTGNLTRRDTEVAGAVTTIDVAGYNKGVVTGVRDSANNLRLISWEVANNGGITRRDTETAGMVSAIAMDSAHPRTAADPSIVVTALRDNNNNLRVISWSVSDTGNIIRRDTEVAGIVSNIDTAQIRLGDGPIKDRFVTAVRDSNADLRIIGWSVDTANADLERLGTAVAGTISNVAVAKVSNSCAITAVRDDNNNLRIISWSVTN
ncbi:MAG: hypothetical protein J7647_02270 [Cyanobacteria bacterium SBLK]|nr:hypothetical protein [Cyanobacteria bacterium SBLK]